MKQEKVIEIARELNAIPIRGEPREFAVVGNANITAFANEIERRTLERVLCCVMNCGYKTELHTIAGKLSEH